MKWVMQAEADMTSIHSGSQSQVEHYVHFTLTSKMGLIILHGPHQSAKKSTITFLPSFEESMVLNSACIQQGFTLFEL